MRTTQLPPMAADHATTLASRTPLLTSMLVVVWALSACSTPRLDTVPTETPPERWQADATSALPHGGNTSFLVDWWRDFDDPLVAGLIQQSQRANPTLTQALARLTQSRAQARAAAGARWPVVDGVVQGTRGASVGSGFQVSSQGSAGVDVRWELDLFGGTQAQRAAADARAEQAALGWHAARVSLAADVAQTYVALRTCEAQWAVSDQDAAAQRQIAQLTRDKLRVGFESPANAALADAAAADATNRALALRADCDVWIKNLLVLTGGDEPALRAQLAAASGRLPQPRAFAVTTLPAQLLQQRPDVAAAERAVVAAAADAGVADAARYPRLSMGGNLAAATLRTGGITLDGTAWGWGPTLVLPIFDAGVRAARSEEARARVTEARAALDGQLRRAVAEVEEALVRLDAATRREGEAVRASQGFRDYFAAAEQRWRIGAGSLIDREDARRTALAAQNALIAVQRERVDAWIQLYRALGGGWSAADPTPHDRIATSPSDKRAP